MLSAANSSGATPLDPDEAEELLLTHVTTRAELDHCELENILRAEDWLKRTRPRAILNEEFCRQLHRRMFDQVWKWAGTFRRSDKNIGKPWPQIAESLRNLFDDTRLWLETRHEPPDAIGARFHHRLVQIHPFANGNGRHARLMTDLLLENLLGCPRFTWGGSDRAGIGDVRERYIAALRSADAGDYAPLLEFVRL